MKIIESSDWFRWVVLVVALIGVWLGSFFLLYILITILAIDSELKTMIRKLEKKVDAMRLVKQQKDYVNKIKKGE